MDPLKSTGIIFLSSHSRGWISVTTETDNDVNSYSFLNVAGKLQTNFEHEIHTPKEEKMFISTRVRKHIMWDL